MRGAPFLGGYLLLYAVALTALVVREHFGLEEPLFVLAIFGGKDVQVAAGPNEAAVKAALAQGGNTRGTTRVYPDANHLFQPAKTGGVQEYSQLKDMVPGLLDETAQWIKDTVKG